MILVDVTFNSDEEIKKIEISGHANMADEGKDLVCAGCSTCFIGALNAIQDIDNFKVKVDKGLGFVEAKKNISNHDKIVLEVLLVQLKSIEYSYSQYLKINYIKEGTKWDLFLISNCSPLKKVSVPLKMVVILNPNA